MLAHYAMYRNLLTVLAHPDTQKKTALRIFKESDEHLVDIIGSKCYVLLYSPELALSRDEIENFMPYRDDIYTLALSLERVKGGEGDGNSPETALNYQKEKRGILLKRGWAFLPKLLQLTRGYSLVSASIVVPEMSHLNHRFPPSRPRYAAACERKSGLDQFQQRCDKCNQHVIYKTARCSVCHTIARMPKDTKIQFTTDEY